MYKQSLASVEFVGLHIGDGFKKCTWTRIESIKECIDTAYSWAWTLLPFIVIHIGTKIWTDFQKLKINLLKIMLQKKKN